jgi:hypothetical protein
LPRDHSFVDAVEALFAAAADGSLERAMYNSIGGRVRLSADDRD